MVRSESLFALGVSERRLGSRAFGVPGVLLAPDFAEASPELSFGDDPALDLVGPRIVDASDPVVDVLIVDVVSENRLLDPVVSVLAMDVVSEVELCVPVDVL